MEMVADDRSSWNKVQYFWKHDNLGVEVVVGGVPQSDIVGSKSSRGLTVDSHPLNFKPNLESRQA